MSRKNQIILIRIRECLKLYICYITRLNIIKNEVFYVLRIVE